MAGTKYVVDVEFRQSGDPSALADKAGEKVDKLKSKFDTAKASSGELSGAFKDLGANAIGVFYGAVEAAGALAFQLGAAGVGAAIGAVTYGVIGLNSELETTKVSLGAVLNANNQASGIEDGVQKASGWIAQMKKDARDLPGEFEDLLGIVQSSAGTAFNAGLDIPRFEKVASSVMAASKALHVQTDQAGRELAQLFEGRAGAHNVLGMRLKIDAHAVYEDLDHVKKKFKDLSEEGRVKAIEDAVGKFEPAIKAFGMTYDAQSSTLVDNVKNLIQLGTKELFGRVVQDLAEINDWFAENRDTVEQYARQAGHWLVDVHDKARKVAEEWLPILKDFGERAYSKFVDMWRDAGPIISSVAQSVKEFLGDKDSVERLTTLLKLYVAAKVGGAVMSGGPFGGVMKAALADGAASSAGGALVGGAGGAGALGTAAFAAAIAGVALAVWQGMKLSSEVNDRASDQWKGDVNQARLLSEDQGGQISYTNEYTRGVLEDAYKNADNFKSTLDGVLSGTIALQDAVTNMTEAAGQAAYDLQDFAIGLHNVVDDMNKTLKDARDADMKDIGDFAAHYMAAMNLADQQAGRQPGDDDKKRKKDTKGGGSTTVNINFTISSNQSPDQIARKVVQKLVDKRRFRVTSAGVPNWGVLPPSGT